MRLAKLALQYLLQAVILDVRGRTLICVLTALQHVALHRNTPMPRHPFCDLRRGTRNSM